MLLLNPYNGCRDPSTVTMIVSGIASTSCLPEFMLQLITISMTR